MPRVYTRVSDAEREKLFWANVRIGDGCWEWTAATNGVGYGRMLWTERRALYAHRIAYELLIGPIPKGLTLDHLCRNTRCVRPDHLEPVTMYENNRRGFSPAALNQRKTHCPKGHPLSAGNLVPGRLRGGQRHSTRLCRTCYNAYMREYRRRHAA